MGVAGCWQLAVHHPGTWLAATPRAGDSETMAFLHGFQKEDFNPGEPQRSLLHWYDCPDWADNLRRLPTIASSGELDRQKQAADVMEAACKERGFTIPHVIGPQTAHKIHPDRYVVLNSGFTFREYAYLNNARQIPMLPDWAIVSATEGRGPQAPGLILASGFFDECWRPK